MSASSFAQGGWDNVRAPSEASEEELLALAQLRGHGPANTGDTFLFVILQKNNGDVERSIAELQKCSSKFSWR